jgi:predicted nucleic acid-binding protein
MNGSDERLVVDTNILVYYLKGNQKVEKYFFDYAPVISFVAELEILSFPGLDSSNLHAIERFLAEQLKIGYLPAMQQHILDIRKQKKLKLPDAIIAATAMYFHIPLVSSDKAFNHIQGLDFIYFEPPDV